MAKSKIVPISSLGKPKRSYASKEDELIYCAMDFIDNDMVEEGMSIFQKLVDRESENAVPYSS